MNTQGGIAAPCYCIPSLSFDTHPSSGSGGTSTSLPLSSTTTGSGQGSGGGQGGGQGTLIITVGQRVQNSLLFPGQAKKPPLLVGAYYGLYYTYILIIYIYGYIYVQVNCTVFSSTIHSLTHATYYTLSCIPYT